MAGLLHPKNFAPDQGGFEFKEGYVRIDVSEFRACRPREPKVKAADYVADPDYTALHWGFTRLDEDMEPMLDESDNPLTETVEFKAGKKSLASVHPGGADSMNDNEVEDLGVAPGTAGPTLFMVNKEWQLHPNSGLAHLITSLQGKVDEKIFDRVWAPDWVGMVCFIKSRPNVKEKPTDMAYNITYVDRVVKMGKSGGGSKAATGKGDDAAAKALKPILEALSQECDGEKVTFKALHNRVSAALKKSSIDVKLHVGILALIKDEAFLKKSGPDYDMSEVNTEEKFVVFGELKA